MGAVLDLDPFAAAPEAIAAIASLGDDPLKPHDPCLPEHDRRPAAGWQAWLDENDAKTWSRKIAFARCLKAIASMKRAGSSIRGAASLVAD